jgi:hypothetical protein
MVTADDIRSISSARPTFFPLFLDFIEKQREEIKSRINLLCPKMANKQRVFDQNHFSFPRIRNIYYDISMNGVIPDKQDFLQSNPSIFYYDQMLFHSL